MKILTMFVVGFVCLFMGQSVFAQDAAVQTGILGWIAAHGGFQAAVLLVAGGAMALLSGVRQVLLIYDGVAPGAEIPAGMAGLSLVNKVCVILGQVIDFLQGNVKH